MATIKSIEEKAKAYDKALEIMKAYYNRTQFSSISDSKEELKTIEKAFPELAESEDERIRKKLLELVAKHCGKTCEMYLYLEKQAEHANFRNKIQIGDKVTRNEDGVLVNLSQLNRVAKKDEKQGEQKPAEWSEEDELSCFESALKAR